MLQIYEQYYQQSLQPFAGEQMGRRRRDEYMDGVPRISIQSKNPYKENINGKRNIKCF